MKFTVYQDNGGRYHWALLDGEDASLAGSTQTYATYEEARRAAQYVHEHVGAATLVAQS